MMQRLMRGIRLTGIIVGHEKALAATETEIELCNVDRHFVFYLTTD